jgi:hypothetical protein
MTNEKKLEEKSAERAERRAYEAPTVRDFFQPLVVLGTGTATVNFTCQATPKPPKHP